MSSVGNNASDGPIIGDSIEEAMQELRRFPRSQWLDLARSDQSQRWRHGRGIQAERYFLELPELRHEHEESLVLICGEIKLRREIGEEPTAREYQQRFPELSSEIALQFVVQRILESPGGDTTDGDAIDDFTLPGYMFLAEIARGSSGAVYQARQDSLARDVAIKVVPISGANPKLLARQRQEAEILARLHHPNVVHIYEVREHRGYMHLVMEYVDGTTLAHRTRARLLTPAESARLTLTLAETVDAVHAAGVLHRDLKPSNVLMTTTGELKITDFGLAKLRAGSSLLTTAESVLGTPSYMAPEQAVGTMNSIGLEADVYSLGAILYELLTGRPPFLGATVLDTLSLIRDKEPVPPRQLQPTTPRDLETICLKCLSKSPAQRYASAAALADDLRRFLVGTPVRARRATAAERLVRWCRRYPAVATLAATVAVLLMAAVVILAVSNNRIRRESAARDAALATARQAVDQMLMRVASDKLSHMPLGHPMREALLQDALKFYEGFLAQAADDRRVRENMASVLNSLGYLQRELGRCDDACHSFQRSIDLLRMLVPADPNPPAIREMLVKTQESLAYTWQINPADSRRREADAHYRLALEMYHDLERDWPDHRQPVMLCLRRLADSAFHRGDLTEAERLWRESITKGEAYLEQHPSNADARSNLCWTCANFPDAILMRSQERLVEAEPILKKGLEHVAILLAAQPRSGQARDVAAFLHFRLAQCYCLTDRSDQAIPLLFQAVDGIEALCAEFPWYEPHWNNAIYIHNEAVGTLQRAGREDDAKDLLRRMVDWLHRIAPQLPGDPVPQAQLMRCRDGLVARLRATGQEDAAKALERNVQPRKSGKTRSPAN